MRGLLHVLHGRAETVWWGFDLVEGFDFVDAIVELRVWVGCLDCD